MQQDRDREGQGGAGGQQGGSSQQGGGQQGCEAARQLEF